MCPSVSLYTCADDVSVFFDRQYSDNQVVSSLRQGRSNSSRITTFGTYNKNSADEIANVNFYAVRPEGTRIRWNKAK